MCNSVKCRPWKSQTRFFQGRDGHDGPPGPEGRAGIDAFVPSNFKIEIKGEPGPKGDTGRIGIKGDKGMMGLLGVPGIPGFPGERGDKVRSLILVHWWFHYSSGYFVTT